MSSAASQPAHKSYFFAKGYADLRDTVQSSWKRNLDSAMDYLSKASYFKKKGGVRWALAVLWFFASLSVLLFGSLFFAALSLVHVAILAAFFTLIYLGFTLLYLIERGYMIYHGIFSACPYCHNRSSLPVYRCPKCGNRHDRLIPSSYGILRRRCLCGAILPATFFAGRGKLDSSCPCCKKATKAGESPPLCVPIVGGPSVGKTSYLYSATHGLIEGIAVQKDLQVRFLDRQNKDFYRLLKRQIQGSGAPAKTTDMNPTAFNYFIKGKGWSLEKLIYIYDAAGEAYSAGGSLSQHKFHAYAHGCIFLIDPFAIPDVKNAYRSQLMRPGSSVRPSSLDLDDAYDRLLIHLKSLKRRGVRRKFKLPLAIVINKVDAFDLEKQLGEVAFRSRYDPKRHKSVHEARDEVCCDFLKKHSMGGFVSKLETTFDVRRFFTCSALNRLPAATGGNASARVLEPFLWILGQADRDFRALS